MSSLKKGLTVAVIQVLLVMGVAGKLMIDRARYPQVWALTAPVDPDLPLRGRYVQLRAVVEPEGAFFDENVFSRRGRLVVRRGRLVAIPDQDGSVWLTRGACGRQDCLTLAEPLAFFIPEDIPDPSIRPQGVELWVRLTVPPRGAPRPIELGTKRQGRLTPLDS